MKIFLIGLMGSGKSFLGKKISESLSLPFIDLDSEIEKQEGISISEIFSTKGEEYFRTVEAAALRKLSEIKEFVMATGGGAPCFHSNMEFIKLSGRSIFLDTPIQIILKRLNEQEKKQRPLLKDLSENNIELLLKEMLERRLPHYQKADLAIKTESTPLVEILKLISVKK